MANYLEEKSVCCNRYPGKLIGDITNIKEYTAHSKLYVRFNEFYSEENNPKYIRKIKSKEINESIECLQTNEKIKCFFLK